MEVSIFTDPAKIGPGVWFKLHLDAVQAVTDDLKRAFIINTEALCENFKCAKCREHFRSFIDSHPFEKYWHIKSKQGEDIGFFRWTWELHNQVNKWAKKYQPTLEEAYAYYRHSEAGLCFDCGTEQTQPPPAPITSIIKEYRERKIVGKPFIPRR